MEGFEVRLCDTLVFLALHFFSPPYAVGKGTNTKATLTASKKVFVLVRHAESFFRGRACAPIQESTLTACKPLDLCQFSEADLDFQVFDCGTSKMNQRVETFVFKEEEECQKANSAHSQMKQLLEAKIVIRVDQEVGGISTASNAFGFGSYKNHSGWDNPAPKNCPEPPIILGVTHQQKLDLGPKVPWQILYRDVIVCAAQLAFLEKELSHFPNSEEVTKKLRSSLAAARKACSEAKSPNRRNRNSTAVER